jgi:hypothetical protein
VRLAVAAVIRLRHAGGSGEEERLTATDSMQTTGGVI